MVVDFIVLAIIFQIKHLLADYYWQRAYHYENKGKLEGWLVPLMDHSLVHALSAFMIAGAYTMQFLHETNVIAWIGMLLAVLMFDFGTHFITDRWKATQKYTPADTKFWRSLGIDQMIHHIVGLIIIATLVIYYG